MARLKSVGCQFGAADSVACFVSHNSHIPSTSANHNYGAYAMQHSRFPQHFTVLRKASGSFVAREAVKDPRDLVVGATVSADCVTHMKKKKKFLRWRNSS